VTTKAIKVHLLPQQIAIAPGALVVIIGAFTRSVVAGVRRLLEIVIAIFRMVETNVELVAWRAGRSRRPPPRRSAAPRAGG
jgi:hypothetical protein